MSDWACVITVLLSGLCVGCGGRVGFTFANEDEQRWLSMDEGVGDDCGGHAIAWSQKRGANIDHSRVCFNGWTGRCFLLVSAPL